MRSSIHFDKVLVIGLGQLGLPVVKYVIEKGFDDVTTDIDTRDIIVAKEIHFLLCESCFWCASCLNVAKMTVTKCPSCSDARLESMSVCDNELEFGYDPERGVILEFSKSD